MLNSHDDEANPTYLLVVAPPISNGTFICRRCISRATTAISSSEGVMRPDRPTMSARSATAASRMRSTGVITPKSTTRKLLQPSTTPTMFLPMSCTSPLTVARMTVPWYGDDCTLSY